MATEAKIKITGDEADMVKSLDNIKKQSAKLQADLGKVAKAGAIAFTGLTATIGASIAAFRVQEQAIFQQEAVLKSTGFAAGLTTKELQNMASGFQQVTTFGDEAIISGQNILLTFKNIGRDVFPQVNAVTLDLAQAMGTDLKSASLQVGKALNDPITGLTMLTRVGITFTDAQKEQIKTLQKSGDLAGAQKVILKELESQFGGSAKAAAQGTGSFIQLANVLGDIAESIGKQFVPLLENAAKSLTALAVKVNENKEAIKIFAKILAAGAGMAAFITALALGGIALSKLRLGLTLLTSGLRVSRFAAIGLTGALTLGLGFVIAFLPEIIAFVTKMVAAFQTAKTEIIGAFQNLGDRLLNIGSKMGQFLTDLFTFNFSGLEESAAAAKDAVTNAVKDTFKDVKKVTQKIVLDVQEEGGRDPAAAEKEKEDAAAALAKEGAARQLKIQQDAAAKANAIRQKDIKDAEAAAKTKRDIIVLTQKGATDELIAAKKSESSALKSLQGAKTNEDRALASIRLEGARAETAQLAEIEDARAAASIERKRAEVELNELEIQGATEGLIALKLEEIEAIKEIEMAKDLEDLELAEIKKERFLAESEERRLEVMNQALLEQEEKKALQAQFDGLNAAQKKIVEEKDLSKLTKDQRIKREIIIADANQQAAGEREQRKAFLREEEQFGTAIATINEALRSDEVQGTKSATGELTALQSSRNSKLKSIGKAAAITNILIKGAESAMNIFTGFSAFPPPVGPILGAIGAAAAIAFSIEKANQVRSAQAGGIVPGAGEGDIIPAFLEPGEIVVPSALSPSFEEQFAIEPDPGSEAGGRKTEVRIDTIIGTEQFVNDMIIPAIKDGVENENADIGVA